MKILVVDDDRALTEGLAALLEKHQIYADRAHCAESAIASLEQSRYDAILLDVMLPEVSGFDLLPQLRHYTTAPVLMLTALSDEEHRVTGLNLGADDYICKPFSSKELVARLRAFNRRQRAQTVRTAKSEEGALRLDREAQAAWLNDHRIGLTAAEVRLLDALLEGDGEPITRDRLYQRVLGRRALPTDRSLDTHISNLRRKLDSAGEATPRIRSHRGLGYALQQPCID